MDKIILLALATNWLFANPYYQAFVIGIANIKPFNCLYCLSFWLYILMAFPIADASSILMVVAKASAVSFLAVFFERIYNSFPVKLK